MNIAMMGVVPAWKIQEILDLPDQEKIRQEQDDLITKENGIRHQKIRFEKLIQF